MKFALERYNHLVNVILHPALTSKDVPDPSKIREWALLSQTEKENIRAYLLRKSLNIKKEREFELLIQQYQAEIVSLLDFVFQDKFNHPSSPFGQLYEAVLKDLGDLLSYIEHRHAKYFNLEEKVPAVYLLVSQTELRKRIKAVKKSLSEAVGDAELVRLVVTPLMAFVKLEGNVSYRQMMYVKELVHELEEMPLSVESNKCLWSLLNVLVYMNFNTTVFVNYLLNQMVATINALPEQHHKLRRLAGFRKKINQMHIKPGVAFKVKLMPIKEQISGWVEEEIFYLEKKQRLLSVAPVLRDEAVVTEEEKLHLSTSVEVLTLLARSAKDSRLILNKTTTSLYRNLSKFCRTVNAEHPSAHSMLKKSYVAERSHKQAAINLLHEMIRNINKY